MRARKYFGYLFYMSFLLTGCEDTALIKEDIMNARPGGTISATLTNLYTNEIFRLQNETFPSYGLYVTKQSDGYIFKLEVSGVGPNGYVYNIEASSTISESAFEFRKEFPNDPLQLNNAIANIRIGSDPVFYEYSVIPGRLLINRLGELGDNVTIQFRFDTRFASGFNDISGVIHTTYLPDLLQ